jgi:beta-glucanase (GH16 family)
MATTRAYRHRCIAGMTFVVAILAVPSTPHRTMAVDAYNHSTKPVLLLVLFGAALALSPSHGSVQQAPTLHLVWSDEFNHDGVPDPANWTYERGFVRNQELQWYQPDNARVVNGLLVIEARREHVANPGFDAASSDWRRNRPAADYTSSSLSTRGLHSFLYGRFEMRARIDTHLGMWPAFWTVGVTGRWPHNGEIDIMEFYRSTLLANVAWGGAEPGKAIWADTRTPLASFGTGWSDQFHVWRMDWDEQSIKLSVDDRVLNDVDLSRTTNQDGSGVNPLRQAQTIILNLAVGATGGDPAQTTFPARYEIDYVRVYQRQ